MIIIDEIKLYVHDAVDKHAERHRLQKQKEFVEKGIQPLAGKLGNENFTSRAKPEVVEQRRHEAPTFALTTKGCQSARLPFCIRMLALYSESKP